MKQAAGLLSLTGSYLGVQIHAGALLLCEGSGEGRCFKTATVSYPQMPRCTALHRAARWPIFLSDYRSVCLKSGGQLSKMITLCIKHAAMSNLSFPSSVFSPLFSVPLRSDGRRTSHLGNLQDFYTHGGGMYTLILLLFLSLLTTHTHIHVISTAHIHTVEVLLMV